jgi:hypothetical protein
MNKMPRHQECQRGSCPNRGTTYCEASRRVTLQAVQEVKPPVTLYGVTFATILNGLVFPSRRITVNLCVACYHILKHDKTIQMLSVIGIGPYEEEQA